MITVYVDMCADLFHFGHVRFLASAAALGDRLIVGIHSDSDIATYKRLPVMKMHERVQVVAACRYVDRVIENAPLSLQSDYLRSLGVDLVCHGDDLPIERLDQFYGAILDEFPLRLVPYTSGISTTDILERVRHLHQQWE